MTTEDILKNGLLGVEYLLGIYRPLCFHPDRLGVTVELKSDGVGGGSGLPPYLHFVITCSERDDGVIIGRSGGTIGSVRLLLHAYSKSKMGGVACILEVRDHRQSKFNPMVGGKVYRRN